MPLPQNINTPGELKNALEYYAAQHTNIDHFEFGKYKNLTEKLKTVPIGEFILFGNWPSLDFRDMSGAFDNRYVSNITIFCPVQKSNQADEEAALVAAEKILTDLLVRMRSDASDNGWTFTINDSPPADPVLDSMLQNEVGYQILIYFGEGRSVVPDVSAWNDLT